MESSAITGPTRTWLDWTIPPRQGSGARRDAVVMWMHALFLGEMLQMGFALLMPLCFLTHHRFILGIFNIPFPTLSTLGMSLFYLDCYFMMWLFINLHIML